jgi:hypothetical protein
MVAGRLPVRSAIGPVGPRPGSAARYPVGSNSAEAEVVIWFGRLARGSPRLPSTYRAAVWSVRQARGPVREPLKARPGPVASRRGSW